MKKLIFLIGAYIFFPFFPKGEEYTVRQLNIVLNKEYIPHDFENGLARIEVDSTGLYGFIDTSGQWIIAPKFHYFKEFDFGMKKDADFHNGYAIICLNNENWAYIDTHGNIQDTTYNDCENFGPYYCRVRNKKNELGFINRKFYFRKIKSKYDMPIGSFLIQKEANKYKLYNFNTEKISPSLYDSIGTFYNGYCYVKIGKCQEIIDTTLRVVNKKDAKLISSRTIRPFYNNSGCGYKSYITGDTLIPSLYKKCYDFSDFRALVKDSTNKILCINPENNVVFNLQKERLTVGDFHNGFVTAKNVDTQLFGLYDVNGVLVLDFQYEYIGKVDENGIVLVKKNERYSYNKIYRTR